MLFQIIVITKTVQEHCDDSTRNDARVIGSVCITNSYHIINSMVKKKRN